jgi:Arc/MetJ-type ribon-helix-helix transcriptional regulator
MAANPIEITLPDEALRIIESRTAAGDFKTLTNVILEGLSLLNEQQNGLEDWLAQEIPLRCQESDRSPGQRFSLDQVRLALAEEVQQRCALRTYWPSGSRV